MAQIAKFTETLVSPVEDIPSIPLASQPQMFTVKKEAVLTLKLQ